MTIRELLVMLAGVVRGLFELARYGINRFLDTPVDVVLSGLMWFTVLMAVGVAFAMLFKWVIDWSARSLHNQPHDHGQEE